MFVATFRSCRSTTTVSVQWATLESHVYRLWWMVVWWMDMWYHVLLVSILWTCWWWWSGRGSQHCITSLLWRKGHDQRWYGPLFGVLANRTFWIVWSKRQSKTSVLQGIWHAPVQMFTLLWIYLSPKERNSFQGWWSNKWTGWGICPLGISSTKANYHLQIIYCQTTHKHCMSKVWMSTVSWSEGVLLLYRGMQSHGSQGWRTSTTIWS